MMEEKGPLLKYHPIERILMEKKTGSQNPEEEDRSFETIFKIIHVSTSFSLTSIKLQLGKQKAHQLF